MILLLRETFAYNQLKDIAWWFFCYEIISFLCQLIMNVYMDSSFSGSLHAFCFLYMEETACLTYILFYILTNLSAVLINQDAAVNFNVEWLLSIKLTDHLFSGWPFIYSVLHETQLSCSVVLCIRVRNNAWKYCSSISIWDIKKGKLCRCSGK